MNGTGLLQGHGQGAATFPRTRRQPRRTGEQVIHCLLFLCGLVSILTTIGIIAALAGETIQFFRRVPVAEFLTGTTWTPLFAPARFGVLPLVAGTFMITAGAAVVALPLGLAAAIYLSEYAPGWARRILKPVLEILAGIPTVVYGYFALTFVTPLLRSILPQTNVFNAASAAIVVGIMILPMVSSMGEDAMRAVPRGLREGAHALGATRLEVSTRVVVPAALSGIVAAFILAISRAVGETMIVTLAAGATPRLDFNYLDSIQTMTAYIVQVSSGDIPHGSVAYLTVFAVGSLLFVLTLILNLFARWVAERYRRVAE